MEEFTTEVKDALCDDIETLKTMLDRLATEIRSVEKGHSIEFIAPLILIQRIEDEVKNIHRDLKDWQNEDDSIESCGEY